MMYPSRPKTALNDLKPTTLTQHHIRSRNPDVVEDDVAVAVRRVVVPEDGKHAMDSDSWGRRWDKDNGLPLVHFWVIRGRLAHYHVDFAAEVSCSRGPPFLEVSPLCQRPGSM
jgi:hypothetical protein